MPLFILSSVLPSTVAGRVVAGAFTAYVTTHIVVDTVRIGSRVKDWASAKIEARRRRVEQAAKEGAREGVREAQASA